MRKLIILATWGGLLANAAPTVVKATLVGPGGDRLTGTCTFSPTAPFRTADGKMVLGAVEVPFTAGALQVALQPTDTGTPSTTYRTTCTAPPQNITGADGKAHKSSASWGPWTITVPTSATPVPLDGLVPVPGGGAQVYAITVDSNGNLHVPGNVFANGQQLGSLDSNIVRKSDADNVEIGSTCPVDAPAGSLCFLGNLYQAGVLFSGGGGSGEGTAPACTAFSGTSFSIPSSTHGYQTPNLLATVYDTTTTPRSVIAPQTVTVDAATFTVAGTFATTVTGCVVINGGSGPQGPEGKAGKDGADGAPGAPGAGTGDVLGPATNTNGYVPVWNGSNSKSLAGGFDPALARTRVCEIHIWGSGAAQALQATDDEPVSCFNGFSATETITSVKCWANAGTGTTITPLVTGGSGLLTGALSCGNNSIATGTLNGTPTLAGGGTLDINVTAADVATTNIRVFVTLTR